MISAIWSEWRLDGIRESNSVYFSRHWLTYYLLIERFSSRSLFFLSLFLFLQDITLIDNMTFLLIWYLSWHVILIDFLLYNWRNMK